MDNQTGRRKGNLAILAVSVLALLAIVARLAYIMLVQGELLQEMALDLHQRERSIKAARGRIFDRNGVEIASNRTVCTVSVVHKQVTDAEEVIRVLCEELELSEELVRKKVETVSSREIIKTNVEKEIGDRIREMALDGVKVDEDYRRYYPFGETASKVLGFTGGDNQGIVGLEVYYEDVLKGTDGRILTITDAAGAELEQMEESRVEPAAGQNLYLSLDMNIQLYCEQAAKTVMEEKQAKQVSVLVMNPQNGEMLAMVNLPEYNLNEPYVLDTTGEPSEDMDALNQMWRNTAINDTYEPGSAFKIITMSAGLESGTVSLTSQFYCGGSITVEDRIIHCHNRNGHGAENFVQGAMNSCNPVFIQVGLNMGVSVFYQYFRQFGLLGRTGIDLPGEAGTIMHAEDAMGEVELATVSFGQSFQLTPLRLLTTVCSLINGGIQVTPHFAVRTESADGTKTEILNWESTERIVSEQTSEQVRFICEKVVSEGSGSKGAVEGYRIGGKTATSQKLPRGSGKYIASFVGFAPADDPQVAVLITIDEPVGMYYGGQIAAPVVSDILENILPYLDILPEETEGSGQE